MKIALLQLNPTVGALDANVERLLDAAKRAKATGATLAVAPELAVVGYPPRDLLDRAAFVRAADAATGRVVAGTPDGLTLVFGTVGGTETSGRPLYNEAVAARDGHVLARCRKQLLPTYDVFDEARHFEPGDSPAWLEHDGHRVALTVCEDAWGEWESRRYRTNPLENVDASTTDVLVNVSASPFTLPKLTERAQVFQNVATRHRVAVALCNQVGGNDELVFDGRSTVWSPDGRVLARSPAFEESIVLCELPAREDEGDVAPEPEPDEAAYRALVLGVRDYTRKCGFSRVVIGLSGGIDSALTAAIATDALGPSNVLGMAMPTRYSSKGSVDDARALAENLGIGLHVVDIDPIFQSYLDGLGPILDRVRPPYAGDVTLENVQARIRGATLMAVSNRSGALVLTTGNKSEIAVGYCTLYGDMVGGLAVISDVPKTMVYRLSRFVNRDGERIPESTIAKPPSAELRPDQKDSDSLPPYDVLDPLLEATIERGLGRDAIIAEGHDPAVVDRVLRMIRTAEYKRRQAAPGIIITRKAFGIGRRMPIAQGFEEWK